MEANYSRTQENFLNQITRRHLVRWADSVFPETYIDLNTENPHYVAFAVTKKWVSKQKDGRYKILSAGYQTASTFLKR